jgi:hypothetical protein
MSTLVKVRSRTRRLKVGSILNSKLARTIRSLLALSVTHFNSETEGARLVPPMLTACVSGALQPLSALTFLCGTHATQFDRKIARSGLVLGYGEVRIPGETTTSSMQQTMVSCVNQGLALQV